MRLPNFLIIGAMKSGTTTLYHDLRRHPAIFMPEEKEPRAFCSNDILSPDSQRRYSKLFSPVDGESALGEASTDYTKRSKFRDVPRRVREVLGGDTRMVYLVRNPVERTISHHFHLLSKGVISDDIDAELRQCEELISVSRYWWQLQAWLEFFPEDQIRVVVLEEYHADRESQLNDLFAFLGVAPNATAVDTEFIANRSTQKPVNNRLSLIVQQSWFYRNAIKPFLSEQLRQNLIRRFLPRAPIRPAVPSATSVEHIMKSVDEDVLQLTRFLNRRDAIWNFHLPTRTNHQTAAED